MKASFWLLLEIIILGALMMYTTVTIIHFPACVPACLPTYLPSSFSPFLLLSYLSTFLFLTMYLLPDRFPFSIMGVRKKTNGHFSIGIRLIRFFIAAT